MIVPMKKVSLVLLDKERKDALLKLRNLGVVHVEQLSGNSEQLTAYKDASSAAVTALSYLSEIKIPKNGYAQEKMTRDAVHELCVHVIDLFERKKMLFEEIASDAAELDRFTGWGEVDPTDFDFLKSKGIVLRMYEIPADLYGSIGNEINTLLLNGNKKIVRFLVVSRNDERPEGMPAEAFEVPMLRCSTKMLVSEIEKDKQEVTDIEKEMAACAAHTPEIERFKKDVEKDIEFENIYSGMGKEDGNSSAPLAWLSGYAPEDTFAELKKSAQENGWALASADPEPEDDPPTKLKNNKLVSFIYPLTDFLGTVPGYREFDISNWFLIFFTIFFGMIFGDAGYGMIMLAAAVALIIKEKTQKKPLNAGLGLLLLLSSATVVWGTVTCTWFGLRMDQLPQWLKILSVPPLSNAYTAQYDGVNSLLTTDQNMQIFCFTLALLQLSVAHIKCIKRDIKTLKVLGDAGALLMLWGMFYVVLMLVVSGTIFSIDKVVYGIPVGKIAVAFVGVGFVLSFVFSNYSGNVLQSILESCKNIISVILGVVNVFSDIVSYIRLWAVGLAGGAISSTVNTMAGALWGHAILFLAFVVLLVFGHGLNIILNILSVIVHGVRLNTLEFSSHLGMAWSGYKYEPFSETAKK